MADLKYTVGVDTTEALSGLTKFNDKLNQINNDFDNISSRIATFASVASAALLGLGGAAAAFADELSDIAAANETTIASVLGLQSALEGAGGNAESVGRMFQTFSNNIEAANAGNLKTVESFRKMGVSISDLGNMATEDLRMKVLKTLAEIPDAAERNAKAVDMFGKSMMGVDVKQFVADLENQKNKYQENESAIKTAGEAFDKIAAIYRDIKVAAAEAFEPIFKYIAKMNVDVKDLTKIIIAFSVALGAAVSVSVIAGFIKLLAVLKEIGVVVSKNKLITIIAAAVAVGGAIATWTGLTQETSDNIDEVNNKLEDAAKTTQETKRDQTGLTNEIEKQSNALKQVGEAYNKQLAAISNKLKLEEEGLNQSEDQKRIAQELAAIDQRTADAKAQLTDRYMAMSADQRAFQKATYDEELAAIERNGQKQRADTEERIKNILRFNAAIKEFNQVAGVLGESRLALFDQIMKFEKDNAGLYEKLDIEQKMVMVQRLRADLMASTANLSTKERAAAQQAISIATTNAAAMSGSYEQINQAIRTSIESQVEMGKISQQTADTLLQSNDMIAGDVIATSKQIAENSQIATAESRTFARGWNMAFKQYAEDAFNAAKTAQTMFNKLFQGMEDLIVNFVKTGKFEWKDFVNSMLEEMLRLELRKTFASIGDIFGLGSIGGATGSPLGSSQNNPMYVRMVNMQNGNILPELGQALLTPGGYMQGAQPAETSWFDTITSGLGSLWDSFAGLFANGGNIGAGKWGIVGEAGPEIVSGPASVTPMSGVTNVTYNINAVDAMSFKQMVAQDPSFIYAVTQQGARGLATRR